MVWKFINAAGVLVDGLDGEVSARGAFYDLHRRREDAWTAMHLNDVDMRLTIESSQDELKLLRLRTRKQELVIVPDTKYLLIVIHETPAA